jgi:hypothetical protein
MAETAALLADDVFLDVPLRQWVISFPFPQRPVQGFAEELVIFNHQDTHRASV